MLRKVLVVAGFMLVFGSGCHESTAIPAAMVQLSSPTDTSTSQPIATNTSTPQPTATTTLKPRPTLKPVGELTQQAEARADFYTLTPSRTPTPTPTVTPTPTPIPVAPLVAHEWTTEPILLRFGQIGGDGADPLNYSLPSLILYSAGTLIYRKWEEGDDGGNRLKLWQVDLDRRQICSLLNAIDQTGFFNYDPSTYLPPGQYLSFDGGSSTVIAVNAWRSKHISLDGLWFYLRDEPSMASSIVFGGPGVMPYIPATLRDTYKLLTHFKVDGGTSYEPNRLAIRIDYAGGYVEKRLWPLTSVNMLDLYTRSNSGHDVVITRGEESTVIYHAFGDALASGNFRDDTHVFWVTIRPLLPYEQPNFEYAYNPINAPDDFRKPLSCDPSDGVLPAP